MIRKFDRDDQQNKKQSMENIPFETGIVEILTFDATNKDDVDKVSVHMGDLSSLIANADNSSVAPSCDAQMNQLQNNANPEIKTQYKIAENASFDIRLWRFDWKSFIFNIALPWVIGRS